LARTRFAALGRISNKTRQAKDKLANCLRDTYSGIKARAAQRYYQNQMPRISTTFMSQELATTGRPLAELQPKLNKAKAICIAMNETERSLLMCVTVF
jgi:hypothetical protein